MLCFFYIFFFAGRLGSFSLSARYLQHNSVVIYSHYSCVEIVTKILGEKWISLEYSWDRLRARFLSVIEFHFGKQRIKLTNFVRKETNAERISREKIDDKSLSERYLR